jgi:hypothetical protein
MEIKIDPEFQVLIPAPSPDELKGLEESIIDEGCRDALVLWEDVLIDGHNRYEICERLGIKFKTISKGFDNRDQAKIWVITNQLSRRNLSPQHISYLRGIRYDIEEKKQGERTDLTSSHNGTKSDAAGKIAKEFGVSPATIHRDKDFSDAVNALPDGVKKDVLSGKLKKPKRDIVRDHKNKTQAPKIKTEAEQKNSGTGEEDKFDALKNLMVWWAKASPADRKYFLHWTKEEGDMKTKTNGGKDGKNPIPDIAA